MVVALKERLERELERDRQHYRSPLHHSTPHDERAGFTQGAVEAE
jgi:hypothetical protein